MPTDPGAPTQPEPPPTSPDPPPESPTTLRLAALEEWDLFAVAIRAWVAREQERLAP